MKKNSLHPIIACLLFVVLSLPSLMETYHATWHDHAVVDCELTDTHLHQDQVDCSLDDLQMSPYNSFVFASDIEVINVVESAGLIRYNSMIENTLHTRLRDRGPPALLL